MQVCLLPRVGGLDFALSPALKPQLDPKEDELTLHKEYRNCGTAASTSQTWSFTHNSPLFYLQEKRWLYISDHFLARCGDFREFTSFQHCIGLIFLSRFSVSCQSCLNPPPPPPRYLIKYNV